MHLTNLRFLRQVHSLIHPPNSQNATKNIFSTIAFLPNSKFLFPYSESTHFFKPTHWKENNNSDSVNDINKTEALSNNDSDENSNEDLAIFHNDFFYSNGFDLEQKDFVSTPSNYLINQLDDSLGEQLDKAQELGFEVIKFKMTLGFEKELRHLLKFKLSNFEIRLDFNSCLSFEKINDASTFLNKIPNLDYLEDPTKYDHEVWKKMSLLFPLAFDQVETLFHPEIKADKTNIPQRLEINANTLVVKPLKFFNLEMIESWVKQNKKITITNNMDSSTGTWKAYFYFCNLKKRFPLHLKTPGLYTHHLYSAEPKNKLWTDFTPFNKSQWIYNDATLTRLKEALEVEFNNFQKSTPR